MSHATAEGKKAVSVVGGVYYRVKFVVLFIMGLFIFTKRRLLLMNLKHYKGHSLAK